MVACHYVNEYAPESDVINVSQELAARFAAFKQKTSKIPGANMIAHAAYKESLRSEIIRLRLSMSKLERARQQLQISSLADIEERDYLESRLQHERVEYERALARFRVVV